MVTFCSKKLQTEPTASELLKKAREDQQLSLKVAADALQLSPKYLQALEEERFQYFPGQIYIKNFIKSYAKFLKLDESELLQKYCDSQKLRNNKVVCKEENKKVLNGFYKVLIFLRQSVVAVVVAFFIFYLGLEFFGIFKAPQLSIESPEEGMITTSADLNVKGQTIPETKVQINGVAAISDENGFFQERVSLNSGSNQIIVTAFKKHGKSSSIVRNVIFKEKKTEEVSLIQNSNGTLGN